MDKGYSLEFNGEYIHIIDDPGFIITIEGVMERWEAVFEASKKYNSKLVLIEATRPVRELSTFDVFYSGSSFSNLGLFGLKVALCLTDHVIDSKSQFLKTVTSNRGVTISFFDNKENAVKWLLD
jgi:hypothetical protein